MLSEARKSSRRPRLEADRVKELKDAFDLFDSKKTGRIDYHEMKVCIRALGFEITKEEVLQLAKEYDREQLGRVEWEDFLEIMTEKIQRDLIILGLEQDPTEELIKAFKLFDEDNSGKITYRKLRRIARELGENLTEDELQGMIDEFDTDLDGAITQEDFIKIMRQS